VEKDQSSVTSKIRAIWRRLSDKEYRDDLVSLKIDNDLSAQIYALREQRGITQAELGVRAGMAQSRIAKLEGSCEAVSLSTLKRLASAFDVGISIKFVSFRKFTEDTISERLDRHIPSFHDDYPPLEEVLYRWVEPASTRSVKAPIRPNNRRRTNFQVSVASSPVSESISA
jgi:transcriptional regulator with XRE-family HTH domain